MLHPRKHQLNKKKQQQQKNSSVLPRFTQYKPIDTLGEEEKGALSGLMNSSLLNKMSIDLNSRKCWHWNE